MSFLYLSLVEWENRSPFAICFWVNLGLLIFLFINLYIEFFFNSRSSEFESNFSCLDAESKENFVVIYNE